MFLSKKAYFEIHLSGSKEVYQVHTVLAFLSHKITLSTFELWMDEETLSKCLYVTDMG